MHSSRINLQSNSNNIVDQILEQGQRLRNSMVQTILNNDPLNTEVINYKHRFSHDNKFDESIKPLSPEEKQLFIAYVRGDTMNKVEEKQALDTFRKMSSADLYEITDRTCLSYKATCNCDTCKAYYSENYRQTSNDIPMLNLQNIQDNMQTNYLETVSTPVTSFLKYVDSLKITVYNLVFNSEGLKKIHQNNADNLFKLPPSYTHSYFIEYTIPDILVQNTARIKAKVDTGIHNNNKVRNCAKLIQDEVIHFKQSSIHEVIHLDTLDLNKLNIKFCISCRTQKQKGLFTIGIAKFKMSSFLNTKYLTCNQELAVMLDCGAPIVLGNLKITVQLGCGKLYFGKEFIDAISLNKEKNIILPENICTKDKDNCYEIQHDYGSTVDVPNYKLNTSKAIKENLKETLKKVTSSSALELSNQNVGKSVVHTQKLEQNAACRIDNKQILFGFIYISEAEFLDSKNTYFTVRPFGQDDLLYSRVIYHSSNPIYNFHQIVPYLYDDGLLMQLRDNFMVFEFYEKSEEGDILIGISKVSLHQFYISLRNSTILCYLLRNNLPVIGADWWESICDPLTGKLYGQVQLLVAFGSEKQIQNLQLSRGFQEDKVVAKKSHITTKVLQESQKLPLKKPTRQKTYKTKSSSIVTQAKTQEKAIQSDSKMDLTKKDEENISVNKDTLGEFLSQLIQQRQTNNCVESSTNTVNDNIISNANPVQTVETESKLCQTSELLDTLQEALGVNSNTAFCNNITLNEEKNCFKVHICIERALHLPAKKKCKVKKTKIKNMKQEDIPPSSYVTLETTPTEMIITPVVQKNCNPIWDYRCEATLPSDLLLNNQKRLILKVWKKCAGNSLQPNLQTDLIIGFAALDLTVFLAGLPSVSGWFNILDFTSKCNGQIKIDVTPMENVNKFKEYKNVTQSENSSPVLPVANPQHQLVQKTEEPHESLSRALKRKFNELDEITERLRSRLSNVTNEETDGFNDELADEFEHDINTLCVEEDYNLIDFEEETSKSNCTAEENNGLLHVETDGLSSEPTSIRSSVVSIPALNIASKLNTDALDKQLRADKERIDTLMEKLGINTNEHDIFASRHVSGCSLNQEIVQNTNNGSLKEFVLDSKNIDPECIINPALFKKLYTTPELEQSSQVDATDNDVTITSDSSSSININTDRDAPDGARYNTQDKG